MGFHVIRLHHLELLAPIPPETRQAYLDFFFGELRHLQLKAMLDVFASDTAIAELLDRYGDVVEAVELENEILIWGIPADRPARWRQTYAPIKRVAPQGAASDRLQPTPASSTDSIALGVRLIGWACI